MTPGALDSVVVSRHLAALDDALRRLRAHQYVSESELAADGDVAWAVERGLQLCAQKGAGAAFRGRGIAPSAANSRANTHQLARQPTRRLT